MKLYQRLNLINKLNEISQKRRDLTLDTCLDVFRKEEKLEEGNDWYCRVCKDHVLPVTKVDLYSASQYLIIVLKRFKGGQESGLSKMLRGGLRKNDTLVYFGIDKIDLSQYIQDEKQVSKSYRLIAVSQHYGSLGGGHYTAVCENNGKWFNFNDSNCTEINPREVCSSAAYVLILKRIDDE